MIKIHEFLIKHLDIARSYNLTVESDCTEYLEYCESYKDYMMRLQSGEIPYTQDANQITIICPSGEFTMTSDTYPPNIEHMRYFCDFDEDAMIVFKAFIETYDKIDVKLFEDCVKMTVQCMKEDVGKLDNRFQANIKLHDYYTPSHVEAIRKIVSLIAHEKDIKVNASEHRFEVISSDREVRALLMDLSVSMYCDIDFIELAKEDVVDETK